MVLGRRRLLSLTCLSQQSFDFCPRAKRSHSNTRAGLVGYLFETAHNAIAPVWQPGAYIRSCELSSVGERAHSNVTRIGHVLRHGAVGSGKLPRCGRALQR
jgi:hypothetical protein